MNCRVLAAGWPFAGLLGLEASRGDTLAGSETRHGVIARDEQGSDLLVYEANDSYVTVELEDATPAFGVDGYPIPLTDLSVGDVVQVVQAQRSAGWVTTELRVLRRSSEQAAPSSPRWVFG